VCGELHFRNPHVPIKEAHLVPTHVTAWERRLEPLPIAPTYRGTSLVRKRPPTQEFRRVLGIDLLWDPGVRHFLTPPTSETALPGGGPSEDSAHVGAVGLAFEPLAW